MPLLFLILFVGVPLLEIYVIVQVGQALGALPTIALLVADSLVGALLLRAQGRSVWRRFRAALASGRPPAAETVDGALVIAGGALMLTPGFVTDALGILLLAPPSRALARRQVMRHARSRLLAGLAGGPRAASRRPTRQDYDVDATAYEIDPPVLPPR